MYSLSASASETECVRRNGMDRILLQQVSHCMIRDIPLSLTTPSSPLPAMQLLCVDFESSNVNEIWWDAKMTLKLLQLPH